MTEIVAARRVAVPFAEEQPQGCGRCQAAQEALTKCLVASDRERLFQALGQSVWEVTSSDGLMVLETIGGLVITRLAWGTLSQRALPSQLGGLVTWVARTGQPLILSRGPWLEPDMEEALAQVEARTILGLPVVAGSQVKAVILALRNGQSRPFTNSEISPLLLLTSQAGLALERASLSRQIEAYQEQTERLLQESTLAQEGERKRISLELHDGVAQWLVAVSHRLQSLEPKRGKRELLEVRQALEQGILELRRVIADLQPPPLEQMGLVESLRQMAGGLEKLGLEVEFIRDGSETSLTRCQQVMVYRIVQEALNNVARHARASRVRIRLYYQPGGLVVEVGDNGEGFDLAQALEKARAERRLGLAGMRQRAEALGGFCYIETQRGAGTTVTLILPFAEEGGEHGVHPRPNS